MQSELITEKFSVTKMITYWSCWWKVDNEQDELARKILTVMVPILVIVWYKLMLLYSTKRGTTPLPPGPYGLPVIGYLPFLGSNWHEKFAEMAHKYGPIFSMRLGSKLHVVVNSMELVQAVARDMDQTFANRSPPITALALTYGGNDIVWTNNRRHWRNMRKLLVSQVLSNANLNACKHFRTHGVRKTVNEVYTNIGKRVNINEISFETEINVASSMLWGGRKSDDRIFDGFREVVFKVLELMGAPNISDYIPMLSWFDLQGKQREMEKQHKKFNRVLDYVINERIHENNRKTEGTTEEDGKKDFLQMLLELKDHKDAPGLFSIDQIKAMLTDIMIATTDTPSTMVEWTVSEIFHNLGVMEKVQDELTRVIGMNNIVEESHLPKLTYLDAVVKETLRLHPPLPLLIQRCPHESCTVEGYTIPKGTVVYMNIWAIQRDPDIWNNPLEFIPERFLNEKIDYSGNNCKFLPFGCGRRICPGTPLGEKMVMFIVASLLHSFDWSLPKEEEFDLSYEVGLTTKKKKPLIAIPSPRLSDATYYEC